MHLLPALLPQHERLYPAGLYGPVRSGNPHSVGQRIRKLCRQLWDWSTGRWAARGWRASGVMGRRREGLSVAAPLRLPMYRHLLSRVYYDVASGDRLFGAVVVHVMLSSRVFPPDPDTEGIGLEPADLATPMIWMSMVVLGIGTLLLSRRVFGLSLHRTTIGR